VVSYEICSGKINAQTAPSPFHPAAISVAPRTLRINKSAKKKCRRTIWRPLVSHTEQWKWSEGFSEQKRADTVRLLKDLLCHRVCFRSVP